MLVIVFLRLVVFRPAPVSVTIIVVEKGRVEETVVNFRAGTVKSRLRSQMSPGISGLVAEIPVEKGTPVEKGRVLLRVDDSEYRHHVALAERSVDAARAAAEEACLSAAQLERDCRRTESLATEGLASDQALEEAGTAAAAAAAACNAARERVREAEAALAVAQVTLDKTVMRAPFAGVVLDVTTEVGEWISPSPPGVMIPPVIDLIDPGSLYVSAPIDEADVARLRVPLPVRITMDAFRGRSFQGTLSYLSFFVETTQEQNRTLTVEAEFTEQELPANVLPGLSADLEIILDVREDVLRIPTYALLEGDRVLVVREGELASVPVTVGLHNWASAEITDGLTAGDRVVVSLDRPEVKAGAKVRVAGEVEQ
ncbi:MAG: efflux RND transporter periplasmic adaptor subunit [Candidatus Eisenbacteria sp.]|nr:efflux RND transporter periplasmic adaptor subunit [Candidatus Eisenbacteria bacterium]